MKDSSKTISGPLNRGTVSSVTVLVDDSARKGFACEHGLSVWIEFGDRQVLLDTGQSNIVLHNAERLGLRPRDIESIVLSHGHYDHTGGLAGMLDAAQRAKVYLHPAALEPKFAKSKNNIREIGVPDPAKQAILAKADDGMVVWTEIPTEMSTGIFVTGRIPRTTAFEQDAGGRFFVDNACRRADTFLDDQAVFLDSTNGLVVLLGCAHAGVVNALRYVAELTGQERIYAVIGGMHLLDASAERIEGVIEAFRRYDVQRIAPAHCTGDKAVGEFERAFPGRCLPCAAGMRIDL